MKESLFSRETASHPAVLLGILILAAVILETGRSPAEESRLGFSENETNGDSTGRRVLTPAPLAPRPSGGRVLTPAPLAPRPSGGRVLTPAPLQPPSAPSLSAQPASITNPPHATPASAASVESAPSIHPSVERLWSVAEADIPDEHALTRYVRWAQQEISRFDDIADYSAVLVKQERIGDSLMPEQQIALKLRHEPFSVYLRFLGPREVQDREVLYIEGENEGKLLAHEGHGLLSLGPAVLLPIDHPIVMEGQKYPLTDIGLRNLVVRFIERCEQEIDLHEGCEVHCYPSSVKLDGRPCTCLKVEHPEFNEGFLFYTAYVYIDDEWGMPVRYESYDWPEKEGEEPVLLESYTYARLNFNRGFTDLDFDGENEDYRFQ